MNKLNKILTYGLLITCPLVATASAICAYDNLAKKKYAGAVYDAGIATLYGTIFLATANKLKKKKNIETKMEKK